MNAKMLITGVAVAVLAAGAAASQTAPSAGAMGSSSPMSQDATPQAGDSAPAPSRHKAKAHMKSGASRGAYAAPSQPIPYAQLDQYMKASPHQRLAMAKAADTGASADTAATVTTGSNLGAAGSDTGSMNSTPSMPGADTGAMGNTDPNGPTRGNGAMNSNPPVNGADPNAADQVPTQGMGHNGSDTAGTPAAGTPNQSSGPTPQ